MKKLSLALALILSGSASFNISYADNFTTNTEKVYNAPNKQISNLVPKAKLRLFKFSRMLAPVAAIFAYYLYVAPSLEHNLNKPKADAFKELLKIILFTPLYFDALKEWGQLLNTTVSYHNDCIENALEEQAIS